MDHDALLYHGTLADHAASILARGLRPAAGAFVRDVYPRAKGRDLVYAAEADDLRKAFSAIRFHACRKLGKERHQLTGDDFLDHGALAVIEGREGFVRHGGGRQRAPCRFVEPGDWYAEAVAPVGRVLVGRDMEAAFRATGNGWLVDMLWTDEFERAAYHALWDAVPEDLAQAYRETPLPVRDDGAEARLRWHWDVGIGRAFRALKEEGGTEERARAMRAGGGRAEAVLREVVEAMRADWAERHAIADEDEVAGMSP